jgi:hypothetical protein
MRFLKWDLGSFFILAVTLAAAHAYADSAPLDHGYHDLTPPIDDTHGDTAFGHKWDAPVASDVEKAISFHTPVKDQFGRGNCSYFSTVAVLEEELIRLRGYARDLDLSEQWLAYVNQRDQTGDGGRANVNFNNLAYYGVAREIDLPYEGQKWSSVSDSPLAQTRCGSLSGLNQTYCLNSHYDPSWLTRPGDWLRAYAPGFINAIHQAYTFRDKVVLNEYSYKQKDFRIYQVSSIKKWLAVGTPILLEVPFYYGAWAHGDAASNGIGRDADAVEQYAQGIVGYPEYGSKDRVISPKIDSAHAITLVGYDDQAVVTQKVTMTDGTTRSFTSQGVYYFKNSWGTGSFGSKFQIKGVSHPGYGVITQRYANEFGSFYRLPFRE